MATPAAAGQADDQLFVDVGEDLGRRLVGQVEVAEHFVADTDRHAEERMHRRMVRREAVAVGVLGQVRKAQRLGVDDEETEDAMTVGQVADVSPCLLADADGDELGQPGPGRSSSTPRAPYRASTSSVAAGHDALQHPLEVQVASSSSGRRREAAAGFAGPQLPSSRDS